MAAGAVPFFGSGKYLKTSDGIGSLADPAILEVGASVDATVTVDAPPTADTATSSPKVTLNANSAGALIASNEARIGFVIRNKTSATLYIGLGFTPTASEFSFDIPAGAMYEPATTIYTGDINGLSVPGGDVMATELTHS